MKHRRALALVAAALIAVVIPGSSAEASHQPAIVVCEYFKPHTGDTTVIYYWDGGQRRYECGYQHPGTTPIADHYLCAYPPEHHSPPDNVWAKQNNCPF